MEVTITLKNGMEIRSKEIPWNLLISEEVEKVIIDNFEVIMSDDMRLIQFRKNDSMFLGFQKTVQGRNVKSIIEIRPDGRIILRDR